MIILGKLLAYLALEAVILLLYLVVLPILYGLPRLGGVVPILIFAVPFVLSVVGLGLVVAGIFRRPIRVQLAIDGFVKLSQLGAPLAAANFELFTLAALASR